MGNTLDTVRLDREIHRTASPNGVTVLSEREPNVRSVAIGVWVRTASAHEPSPRARCPSVAPSAHRSATWRGC